MNTLKIAEAAITHLYKQDEEIQRLRTLLAEWVDAEMFGPFFHEDEHGPDSLLHRTRKELE